jgi:hypothetical protein
VHSITLSSLDAIACTRSRSSYVATSTVATVAGRVTSSKTENCFMSMRQTNRQKDRQTDISIISVHPFSFFHFFFVFQQPQSQRPTIQPWRRRRLLLAAFVSLLILL